MLVNITFKKIYCFCTAVGFFFLFATTNKQFLAAQLVKLLNWPLLKRKMLQMLVHVSVLASIIFLHNKL